MLLRKIFGAFRIASPNSGPRRVLELMNVRRNSFSQSGAKSYGDRAISRDISSTSSTEHDRAIKIADRIRVRITARRVSRTRSWIERRLSAFKRAGDLSRGHLARNLR